MTQFCIRSGKSVASPILALLIVAPAAYAENSADIDDIDSDSGIINRAPFVSSKIKPSNLDRISTDISDITESLNNILSAPIEEQEVITETEVEKIEEPAQPLVAEPVKVIPKKIEVARPVLVETKPLATQPKQAEAASPLQLKELTNVPEKQPDTIARTDVQIKEKTKDIKYLKKGLDGKDLPDNAPKWSCVEDVKNGLIWEVKSADGDIQDKNNSYTWFQPGADEAPQGVADGGRCKGESDCDTYAYIEQINQKNYCGYSNWRLPTKEEMLSIVNLGDNAATATIDTEYFPDALPSWYWTASSNESHPEHAWYVLFKNGIALNDLKERPKHIRLVRSLTEKS